MVTEIVLSFLCGILGGVAWTYVSVFAVSLNLRRLTIRVLDLEERAIRENKRYANLVGRNKQDRDADLLKEAVDTLQAAKQPNLGYNPADPFLDKVWGK